ncbi:MAG: hypothetical protein IPH75_14900 [bacterium]|nr:hypothetical protein [bacterium]
MGNKWLTMFAWLALALTIVLASSGKVHALSVIDYQIDSTEIQEIVQSARPGMYLHNPCFLILRYYQPDSLHPVLNKTTVKLNWEGWPSGDQILTDGYHVWAEDTLHQLDLKLVGYGKLKLTGLRLRRDSVTIVPVWLWPGRDSATFDYSRPNDAGMKLFPMPTLKAGVVYGRVVDAETKEPISEIRVRLLDDNGVTALTDDSGRFQMMSGRFGRGLRMSMAGDGHDSVEIEYTKYFPWLEAEYRVTMEARKPWWKQLFSKREKRALLVISRHGWGGPGGGSANKSYSVVMRRVIQGDLAAQTYMPDGIRVIGFDESGAEVRYDSALYRAQMTEEGVPRVVAPNAVGAAAPPKREVLTSPLRLADKPVYFVSKTTCGGWTYSIQWIRTEE